MNNSKRMSLLLFLLPIALLLFGVALIEAVVREDVVHSQALEGNLADYSPDRRVWVYLPEGYQQSTEHYPVLYWLHAADGHGKFSSLYSHLDELVEADVIKPMIVVTPDAGLSFYANSSATGNWEDFIAGELVDYIDRTYRTIPRVAARGIAGYSMGGGGALRLAMRHPDLFCAVYAMSPGGVGLVDIQDAVEIKGPFAEGFLRVFASNPDNPPSYYDPLHEMVNGENQVIQEVWDRLVARTPVAMVGKYAANLASLRGIRFDVGNDDRWRHIPPGCRALSAALTEEGIDHIFEEYKGNHDSHISERRRELLFPFFSEILESDRLPDHFLQLRSLAPAVVATPVDRAFSLNLKVELEAERASERMELDLSPLGIQERVPLEALGEGRYAADVEFVPPRNGYWDLPIWIEPQEGAPYTFRFVAFTAYPDEGVGVLDDELADDWSVEAKGGAQVPISDGSMTAVSGDAAMAFQVEPASFIGWSLNLTPDEPVAGFGYTTLVFSFHPGDATGRALNFGVNAWATKLLKGDGDGIEVDLEAKEWQRIEIPLSTLKLAGPIELIQFNGDLEGTFYIDDLRLIAEERTPMIATAVVEASAAGLPDGFALGQNFPNPFNGETAIRFSLPSSGDVELVLFDLLGQQVVSLIDGPRNAGTYTVRWDGRDDRGHALASGIYFYRLRAGRQVQSHKLLLLQ